jgi:hypothetical protein
MAETERQIRQLPGRRQGLTRVDIACAVVSRHRVVPAWPVRVWWMWWPAGEAVNYPGASSAGLGGLILNEIRSLMR